ncbi:oligosaccharide flippase family protein [bacterium]|nr:oligosaccharide flippase family protein [bacterium]
MHFKKGSLYLMAAWAITLLTGYLYNFWLTHRFSQGTYGDYQVVTSVLVWMEIVVINGLPYTIQKFIGSHEKQAGAILRTALILQLWVAVCLFAVSFITAPWIAALFKSPSYTYFFRVAFFDVLFLGFYHLLQAYQNGEKQFGKQALLIVLYAVGKLIVGVSLVLIFGSLTSVLLANIAASILGVIWGGILLGNRHLKPGYPSMPLIRFTIASLGFLWLLYLLFSIDLWFVKVYLHSEASGYYGLAGMLARAPYFLCIGVSATMLPTLATALSNGDFSKARHLFQQANQFLWLLLAPVGVLMVIFRYDIISSLFKPEYAPAAPVTAVLVWGMIALAFFFLNATLLNADHRPWLSFILVGATVILDVVLNAVLVPAYGVSGGALSTSLSCLLGSVVSYIFVLKKFRVVMPVVSFLRITGVAAGVGVLAGVSGIHGGWAIPAMIAAMGLYLGILFWIGELSRKDIEEIFGGEPRS